MDALPGWRPDPSHAHELRFFAMGGKPTRLVSDDNFRTVSVTREIPDVPAELPDVAPAVPTAPSVPGVAAAARAVAIPDGVPPEGAPSDGVPEAAEAAAATPSAAASAVPDVATEVQPEPSAVADPPEQSPTAAGAPGPVHAPSLPSHEPQPVAAEASPSPAVRFCAACGTGLKDTAAFCPKCGQRVAAPPQPGVP